MDEPTGTIVVVPCFDEQERLDVDAFLAFAEDHPDIRFLLVDDGSGDDTLSVLQSLASRRPDAFSVLPLSPNQGKAEAVRRGILLALDRSPARVGFWDADLATPLQAVPEFVSVLERRPEAELVLGSRVRLLGRTIERHQGRHYFGRVAATVVSNLLGLPVYDTQCGAKLFRATPRLRQLFTEPFVTRWAFDVEILARWLIAADELERRGASGRIVEIPVAEWHDVGGSKLGPLDFIRAPGELARIWRAYGRELRR